MSAPNGMRVPILNASEVAASNNLRSAEGRNLALLVYAIAGLSHVLMSLLVALVISWRAPEGILSLMPYAKDVRVATFYWWYAWLSMTFLISCAGGTITMGAVVLLYVMIVLTVFLDAMIRFRKRCNERHMPADQGGRTLAAAARIEWLTSNGLRGLTEEEIAGRAAILGGEATAATSGGKSVSGIINQKSALDTKILAYLELDKIPILAPQPDPFSPAAVGDTASMSPAQQKEACGKVNAIVKLAQEGSGVGGKKPWTHYPDRNPDGSPSDRQIALEEAAAWKVRRAFGDATELMVVEENGSMQLRDADSGVIPGSKMETAMRLARMLMRYSPGSLRSMEQILDSYNLQEDRLFTDLQAKYGPEPSRAERKRWATRQRQRGQLTSEEVARALTVPELPNDMYWTRCPVRPVPPQLAAMVICFVFIVLCAIGMYTAVSWWPVTEYRLVEDDKTNGQLYSVAERKPDMTAKAEFLIYGWPGTASEMRVQQYLDILTGWWYKYYFFRLLGNDAERREQIQIPFVEAYDVDMSIYINKSYADYATVNDWWGRRMDLSQRPLAPGWNTTGVVIAPSDGRITAFSNVQRARKFWIKGGRFSYHELLNGKDMQRQIKNNYDYFSGGTILLSRLAVADYHHFVAPVSGRVVDVWNVKKYTFSNTPTAVQSGNNVLYNTRSVVLIDTTDAAKFVQGVAEAEPMTDALIRAAAAAAASNTNNATSTNVTSSPGSSSSNSNIFPRQPVAPISMGVVAMVLIGSTLAGSVELTHRNYIYSPRGNSTIDLRNKSKLEIGSWVRAGDELGRFHLGGSTVALLFRAGAVKFRCSYLERSAMSVETKTRLGESLGVNQGTANALDDEFCV